MRVGLKVTKTSTNAPGQLGHFPPTQALPGKAQGRAGGSAQKLSLLLAETLLRPCTISSTHTTQGGCGAAAPSPVGEWLIFCVHLARVFYLCHPRTCFLPGPGRSLMGPSQFSGLRNVKVGQEQPPPWGLQSTIQSEAATVTTPLQQSLRPPALCPLHPCQNQSLTQNQMRCFNKGRSSHTHHQAQEQALLAPEHSCVRPWVHSQHTGPHKQHQLHPSALSLQDQLCLLLWPGGQGDLAVTLKTGLPLGP